MTDDYAGGWEAFHGQSNILFRLTKDLGNRRRKKRKNRKHSKGRPR